MNVLLLFLLLQTVIGFAFCDIDTASEIQCPGLKERAIFPQPGKIQLGTDYKVVLRFTDWRSNYTAKFDERDYNGSKIVDKWDREGHFRHIDNRIEFNETWTHQNQNCRAYNSSANPSKANIYDLNGFILREFKELDGSSFSSLLQALVSHQGYTHSKLLDDTEGKRLAGVDTLEWLACQENVGTMDNDGTMAPLNLQVIVEFAGDKTQQKPYDPAFVNPHVYGIHIFLYNGGSNGTNITDHISFELVEHDKVRSSDLVGFVHTPPGVYCHGVPKVQELPFELPSVFEVQAEFKVFGGEVGQLPTIDSFQLAYDAGSKLLAFELDFSKAGSRDNPFYGTETGFLGHSRVVHDFNYGLEYLLSYENENSPPYKCNVQAIHGHFGDVLIDKNGTWHLDSPQNVLLLDLKPTDFYYSGKMRDDSGIPLDVYVGETASSKNGGAVVWSNETVVELFFWPQNLENGETRKLHSVAYYYKSVDGSRSKRASFRFSSLKNATRSELFDISLCLDSHPSSGARKHLATEILQMNGLAAINHHDLIVSQMSDSGLEDKSTRFYLPLSGASISMVREFGYGKVLSALVEAISNCANVSVLRLHQVELKQLEERLFAYFTIGKRSGVSHPAPIAGLKEEYTVEMVQTVLNSTATSKQGFSFDVFGDGKKSLTLKASGPLGRVHPQPAPWPPTPPPKPTYTGFSGSSMLITAFFSFVFGVGLVIGSIIFYQKRQQLRQMAYQVFE